MFVPRMLRKPVQLGREDSVRLAVSADLEEHILGLSSLFYGFPNDLDTWDLMEHLLISRPAENTSRQLPYLLAHAPWHG